MKHENALKLGILAGLLVTGCTNSTPQVSLLSSMDQGLTPTSTIFITSDPNSVVLTANCPIYIQAVDVSFDAGGTWQASKDLDATSTSCASGQYKINLSLVSFSMLPNDEITLQLRPQTVTGYNSISQIKVRYVRVLQKTQETLAGSEEQTDGMNYHLKGRVRAQEQNMASGGNYRLRGWFQ